MNANYYFLKYIKAVILFILAFTTCLPAHAADHKTKFNYPASAKLFYFIRADIKGLQIEGAGLIDWERASDKYLLSSETRTALTGILVAEKSVGLLDTTGLAPEIFSIKRFRKDLITTSLDRKNRQINYQGNATSQPLLGTEQDRLSVLWQLLTLARSNPIKFSPGSQHKFMVVGSQNSEPWIFEVKKTQRLQTGSGDIDAVQISRLNLESPDAQSMEIWLAPTLDWYPVKIRLTEKNGDYVEQSLEKIEKK